MLAAVLAAALTFAPVGAPVGTPVVARASHLAPNTRYALVWHTSRPHWRVEDGNFLGIVAPDTAETIASGVSRADGSLALHFEVPEDFGYLHDVELQADGAVAAHQGFTVIPKLTISPQSGPLGTPVTVTLTGIGYRFYESVWHLMYDGAQTGWLSAITTHGTARATIPATGAIGMHTLQALEGAAAPYLNEQQSPNYQPLIPTVVAQHFRIVAGPPRLPPSAVAQSPARVLDPTPKDAPAVLATDFLSGTVGSPVTLTGHAFAPQSTVSVEWQTVVGNHISGSGWETEDRPLLDAETDRNGTFAARFRTPADLGGEHRIIVHAPGGALTNATTIYRIVPSVSALEPAIAGPGDPITIRVHGAGWTQTGNVYTVVIDNSYFGYACGFNSQGDITVKIRAPGQSGWHFVDLYPAIFNGKLFGPGTPPQGSDVNGSYFLLPMLNVADHPGERLPAFHLAFRVRGSLR
jgi:hypothetical protein